MSEQMTGLEEIQFINEITVKGEKLNVSPFKFKQFLRVMKIVSNIVSDADLISASGILFSIVEREEVLYELFEMVTGKPKEFFNDDSFDTSEALELIALIWKVNQDFFYQKVTPGIKRILGEDHKLFELLKEKTNEMSQEIDQTVVGQM